MSSFRTRFEHWSHLVHLLEFTVLDCFSGRSVFPCSSLTNSAKWVASISFSCCSIDLCLNDGEDDSIFTGNFALLAAFSLLPSSVSSSAEAASSATDIFSSLRRLQAPFGELAWSSSFCNWRLFLFCFKRDNTGDSTLNKHKETFLLNKKYSEFIKRNIWTYTSFWSSFQSATLKSRDFRNLLLVGNKGDSFEGEMFEEIVNVASS